jgi:hypothetical protein
MIVPAYGHRKAKSDDESQQRYACANHKVEIVSRVVGDGPLVG